METLKQCSKKFLLTVCALSILVVVLGSVAVKKLSSKETTLYSLPVGQGDSSLILLETGEKILIDAGPGSQVTKELGKILSPYDTYIDLLILSHTDKDHIAGFIPVLQEYDVGAVIGTGRKNETEVYKALRDILEQKKIPLIGLQEGDTIRIGSTLLDILSPSLQEIFGTAENETSLVIKLQTETMTALYTGDIGMTTEERITKDHDVDIDVLKVAHHGSRFSSSDVFLKEATPLLAIISVGKNTYGHPSPEAVDRIKNVTNTILRTDEEGIIKVSVFNKKLKVETIH